ncbi:hypothetical protein ACJ5H2_02665 [Nocardioides sp. R1-1]|uniref:hypothetical protein n=1 Tax=Nocardioides sp. R1-1 TaxID=3383502 RepID=UPI0038CFD1B7
MLPSFEIAARHRPVALVAAPGAFPLRAPFAAVEAALSAAPAELALAHPDGTRLAVRHDTGRASLSIRVRGGDHTLRSRRHGRTSAPASRLGLTLTGSHLAVLCLEREAWVVRGRIDLRELDGPDTRDPAWLAGLRPDASAGTGELRAGPFGQLGLRDVRLVSYADGSPYRVGREVLFTATSAGPGFFDTAHTSVWSLAADGRVAWRSDLFFERPDRPGVYGDHATHLVRDGDRWLVATSTWSDFPARKADRVPGALGVTLAESSADLTSGRHVLPTRRLALPTHGASVGVWDPHLVRTDEGWLVGYVSARRFFDFHPVLAAGPSLDELALRGAATDRRATEGTTLLRVEDGWRVLASDGRDNRRAVRGRFPVFDTALAEVGTLAAPYPTNIPWPTVVPPDPDLPGDRWRLVTFDGTRYGGRLAGYGTHGDLVVMSQRGA